MAISARTEVNQKGVAEKYVKATDNLEGEKYIFSDIDIGVKLESKEIAIIVTCYFNFMHRTKFSVPNGQESNCSQTGDVNFILERNGLVDFALRLDRKSRLSHAIRYRCLTVRDMENGTMSVHDKVWKSGGQRCDGAGSPIIEVQIYTEKRGFWEIAMRDIPTKLLLAADYASE